jgi:FAD/FMN-containing dehydrogenase
VDHLCAVVRKQAAAAQRKIRAIGSGHSSSPLFETDDCLISLEHLTGLVAVDKARSQATLQAGTTLEDAGRLLYKHGLAFPNIGDIDQQTLAGVIATGTHGTGECFQNLAAMLIGGRAIRADGEAVGFGSESSGEKPLSEIDAFRVSLGALGILADVRLQLEPTRYLYRREWCSQIDDFLPHAAQLFAENRHADFYWYPRSDRVKVRTVNTFDGPQQLPYAKCVQRQEGWTHEVIAQRRELRFEETEYSLPAEAGFNCFREIRQRIKAVHRRYVGWRVLYRTVRGDSAYLSPQHERDSVTISVLQNSSLPYAEYFADLEPIFRAHGGRPHWGKKHNLAAAELRELYPRWQQFADIRQRWDPAGVFLSPPLQHQLVDNASAEARAQNKEART